MSKKPAILSGKTDISPKIPFVRPELPQLNEIETEFDEILTNGMVTTGPYAEQLGEKMAIYLGVKHAIAVSSCTMGLILAIKVLDLPENSEVILPSFTFIATGLGPIWNRLKLRFVDIDPHTMNIDPEAVKEAINPSTSAVIAVHQFGNPAPMERLEEICSDKGIRLIFDSAHGLGSLHHGKPLGGYGEFEVFSLSPTKLMIAGEGGIVTTNDDRIAEKVKLGRNYGNPGNYDCLFPGFNCRMSELHAILALKSLDRLESAAKNRNRSVSQYKERLSQIPGISFQTVHKDDRSSYKDFTIVIDESEFGMDQNGLKNALEAEGIGTRIYYSPVLHQMEAYRHYIEPDFEEKLKHTIYMQTHALSLPLYSNMTEQDMNVVCEAIYRIHNYSSKMKNSYNVLRSSRSA